MDSMQLHEDVKRHATEAVDRGETSESYFDEANRQELNGFSVSAPFTRLLATYMRSIEEERRAAVEIDSPAPRM